MKIDNAGRDCIECMQHYGIQESETEVNPDVKEYAELMKKLLGILMSQSCEMAALIYQNYCIEKKTTAGISKKLHINEESIQVIAQYYDKAEL